MRRPPGRLSVRNPARSVGSPTGRPAGVTWRPRRAGRELPLAGGGDDALGISRLSRPPPWPRRRAAKRCGGGARGRNAGPGADSRRRRAVGPGLVTRHGSDGGAEAGADSGASYAAMLQALDAIRSRNKAALLAIEGVEGWTRGRLEVLSRASRRFAGAWRSGRRRTPPGETAARRPIDGFGLVEVAALSEREVERALRAFRRQHAAGRISSRRSAASPRAIARRWKMSLGDLWETGGVRYRWGCDSLELAWDRAVPLPAGLAERGRRESGSPEPAAREILNLTCLSGGRCRSRRFRSSTSRWTPRPAVEELVGAGLAAFLTNGLRWASGSTCERRGVWPRCPTPGPARRASGWRRSWART